MIQLRVYRVAHDKDCSSFGYEYKEGDVSGRKTYSTLKELTEFVCDAIIRRAESKEYLIIDFSPYHDIEIPLDGILPRYCLALSESEQKEFWRYLSEWFDATHPHLRPTQTAR